MSSTAPNASSGCPAPLVDEECAVIGVDLGVRRLAVAAPAAAGPDVLGAFTVDGQLVRALYDEADAVVTRYRAEPGDHSDAVHTAVTFYERRLRAEFRSAAAALCDYFALFGSPVIAIEDLPYDLQALSVRVEDRSDASAWLIPAFEAALVEECERRGFDVEHADPDGTTRECHLCGADASGDHTLRCPTPACEVEGVCRDRSAAVSIARRVSSD